MSSFVAHAQDETKNRIIAYLLQLFTQQDAYSKSVAQVRAAATLPDAEVAYMQKRQEYITARAGKQMPKIAVCISGGGLRALTGGLGFLRCMQDNGLLDITSYLCGLSGSTWAISGWLESQQPVADYIQSIKPALNAGLLHDVSSKKIVDALLKKMKYDQQISIDDIWGSLIAQKIIYNQHKKDLMQISLSNYVTLPADGSLPIPIYNCVTPLDTGNGDCYKWIEWTPFEVRCPYLQTAVPLWSVGRRFKEGVSVDSCPVLPLSFGHGVWGSAMSGDAQDLIKLALTSASGCQKEVLEHIQALLEKESFLDDITSVRPLPACVPNWNYCAKHLPCADIEALTLVDSAFLCNTPLPPVLEPERAVDIIILVDLTCEQNTAFELECMAAYAHKNKLPFPVINRQNLNNVCSVHGTLNSGAPMIIYFPLVANKDFKNGWNPLTADFTSTFNLQYTPEQVDLMAGLMYAACQQNIVTILDVVQKNSSKNSY